MKPLFHSLSKHLLELLLSAHGLKKKFGTRLQKRIMGYELSTGGLVSVYFIQQKALTTTRELGFRTNCDLQLFLFGWFRQLPKQWLL